MRLFLALSFLCWSLTAAAAQNTLPLSFGMTPQETEVALGVPLRYLSGPPHSERYAALRPAGVPGLYPSDEGLVLQFRKDRLTGWRKTWRLRRLWFL
ncbi:MAG: hypothetical protein AB7K04_11760 [Pseudorhodoplanes sp.]